MLNSGNFYGHCAEKGKLRNSSNCISVARVETSNLFIPTTHVQHIHSHAPNISITITSKNLYQIQSVHCTFIVLFHLKQRQAIDIDKIT